MRFPNLGSDNVIVPGMAALSFNIALSLMADLNRVLVSNVEMGDYEKVGSQIWKEWDIGCQ